MKSTLAALFAAVVFSAAAHAADRPAMVIQVSDADPATLNIALVNAKNLQAAYAERGGVDLEIVVYGPAVRLLASDSEYAERIAATVAAGVPIVACRNTMSAMKLEPADMNARIGYVPVGAGEILERQRQGWAYLRTGSSAQPPSRPLPTRWMT